VKTSYLFHNVLIASILTLVTCANTRGDNQPPPPNSDFQAYVSYANQLFRNYQDDEAIEYYNKAIDANPYCQQAFFNRGLVFANRGDLVSAQKSYQMAIDLTPNYLKAHLMLGETLKKQNKPLEAITQYRKVLAVDPNHFDANFYLARTLADNHNFTASIEHFKRALNTRPDDMQCKLNFGNTLNMANQTEKALAMYKSMKGCNHDTAILYNIAYTLKKLGRLDEAFVYYKKVLAINPDHTEAHFGLGLAYLIAGNFREGWKEYEWRQQQEHHFKQPRWDGSDAHGKKIFLHAEQGLGDTFQFIRFAKVAKERGATVIVASQKPLVKLLSLCDYIDQVVPLFESAPPFDAHASLVSLPLILDITEDTIPTDIPYLQADENLVDVWREKLSADTNFKIGICWQGNENYSTTFLRNAVAAKSIQLIKFAPISLIPGVSLYCLQKTTGEDQLNNLPNYFVLHQFGPDFDNSSGRFMDTAAVMKNLDLIITIDTSIAHLAGALGMAVWVLLPEPADWRWMLYPTKSPWYPTMKLFRQPKSDNWEPVIQTITQKVFALVEARNNNCALQQQTQNSTHTTPFENVKPHIEKLMNEIIELEVQAYRTDNQEALQNIRVQLDECRATFAACTDQSYELDKQLSKILEISKKLWVIKDALLLLKPYDEAFSRIAQRAVALCVLRKNATQQILDCAQQHGRGLQ